MGHVMLPVPEHHLQSFNQWLMIRSMKEAMRTWTPAKVVEAVALLRDDERAVVLAAATEGVGAVSADDVAERLGIPVSELLDRLTLVNDATWAAELPNLVLIKDSRHSPTGRPQLLIDAEVRKNLIKALEV